MRCDGQPQCPDLSDEADCRMDQGPSGLLGDHHQRPPPFSLATTERTIIGPSGSRPATEVATLTSEVNDFDVLLNAGCLPSEWTCSGVGDVGWWCLPGSMRCDGIAQCPDLSDETSCPPKFQCLTSGDCIPMELVCDGVPQCVDGSDELMGCLRPYRMIPPQYLPMYLWGG